MQKKVKQQVKVGQTRKERAAPRVFSAQEKSQAVLSVWTERRKPREVCNELEINWTMLGAWQNRALEGMLSALEPRTGQAEDRGPMLGARLQKLLTKKLNQREGAPSKIEQRLIKIQQNHQKTT